MKWLLHTWVVAGLALASPVWPCSAQLDYETIEPVEPLRESVFGSHVEFVGDELWISDPGDDERAPYNGAVRIYERSPDGWSPTGEFRPDTSFAHQRFGWSFTVADDTAHVIATGRVYTFVRDGQVFRELAATTLPDSAFYPQSLFVRGSQVFVGGRHQDGGAIHKGAVFVFRRSPSGLTFEHKIQPSPLVTDIFGASICSIGEAVIISAHRDDEFGQNAGAIYVYANDGHTWNAQQKFTPDDISSSDQFGREIACLGRFAIVHSYSGGKTYVLDFLNGKLRASSTLIVPGENRFLGSFTAIGNHAFIPGRQSEPDNYGNTLLHVLTVEEDSVRYLATIRNPRELDASVETDDGGFGESVALSDEYLVIAAPYRDSPGKDETGVVFVLPRATALETRRQTSLDRSTPVEMSVFPNPTSSATTLRVHVRRAGRYRTTILNSLGQTLRVGTTAYWGIGHIEHRVELADLAPGVFFVSVCGETDPYQYASVVVPQ